MARSEAIVPVRCDHGVIYVRVPVAMARRMDLRPHSAVVVTEVEAGVLRIETLQKGIDRNERAKKRAARGAAKR